MNFRKVIAYENYFEDFLVQQPEKVQNKIFKILEAIELLEHIPSRYLNIYQAPMAYMKQEYS